MGTKRTKKSLLAKLAFSIMWLNVCTMIFFGNRLAILALMIFLMTRNFDNGYCVRRNVQPLWILKCSSELEWSAFDGEAYYC